MSTKLTLLVEEGVIKEVRIYAKKHSRSISKIVEEYLKSNTSISTKDKKELNPKIKDLWGSVKIDKNDINYQDILEEALVQKYLK
jgi:hypothetical protein